MRYFLDLLAELKKGEVAPVYLFHGPEVYLQREAVRRFRETLVGGDALNYQALDGEEVSPQEVVEIANTLPLFTPRRLVVVKNAPYFTPGRQKEEPALIAYLRQPNAAACLIFCTAAVVDKHREVYKLVQARGRAVEFTHLAPEDLKKWFQKRARQAGKTLEPAAAEALLGAGRELTVLVNELEKVFAYTGDKATVTAEDVAAVITAAGEETVFAAMDAFGERRYPAALAKIRVLLETEPAGVVLALLARQLRLIILAQDFFSAGGQDGTLARELGVHPFVGKKVAAQARRFPRTEVEGLFQSLLELDAAVKTGREEFLAGLERRLLLSGLKKTIPR